jgi:hypothetical protein
MTVEQFRNCAGFTDSTLTVSCPDLVTCEVRIQRDGTWATWLSMCDSHADGAVEVLSQTEGYAVERRPLCPDCTGTLAEGMRDLGTEVTVSTARPLVAGPYTTEAFVCPHGVAYWIEPTGEQIAAWTRESVK